MLSFHLNIDDSSIREYSQKLQTLSRSALPVAMRGTLNDTGFLMKKETMPKYASQIFEERQPNFFKANSKVEPAQGFDVKNMVTTVGFISSGLHNSATNYAVRDLDEQERGGTIDGRSFKPLPAARKGGSGNVRPNSRISQILKAGNVLNVSDNSASTWEQRAIRTAIAAKVGGYVLNTYSGKGGVLWRIKSIKRVGSNTFFTKEKLYSFKKDGTAKVHATGFMKKAALEVQKEMEFLYIIQANRQIGKHLSKFKS